MLTESKNLLDIAREIDHLSTKKKQGSDVDTSTQLQLDPKVLKVNSVVIMLKQFGKSYLTDLVLLMSLGPQGLCETEL